MTIRCPFCCSKKTVLLLSFLGTTKVKSSSGRTNREKLSKNRALLSIRNSHYSLEYNGKVVRRKMYDVFCKDCGKPFYFLSNMLISDISILTFIVETGLDRWKYVINFEDNNYSVDYNYFTKVYKASLTPARKFKLLKGIDESSFFKWELFKYRGCVDYDIKWNVYVEFCDGQVYCRGGYDEYPSQWMKFITPFISVFKNKIFKTMK